MPDDAEAILEQSVGGHPHRDRFRRNDPPRHQRRAGRRDPRRQGRLPMTDYDFVIPQGLLIVGDDARSRLYVEQQKLRAYFPQFTLTQKPGSGKVRVRGTLTTNTGRRYPVKIKLSERYPHEIPKVFPVDWDSRSPHSYPRRAPLHHEDDQWRN